MSEENKSKKRAYIKSSYANLSEDMKDKKREYAKNRYHNMSEKKSKN